MWTVVEDHADDCLCDACIVVLGGVLYFRRSGKIVP